MNPMSQNDQNFLNQMYVPIQPMNLKLGPPKNCEKHQKPLLYYNKSKPENVPICLDCLTEEAKEINPPNLYVPYQNIEQDYYFQKKSLNQIKDQVNNEKKYGKHIYNFQQLLTRYFSQFINKFIKEKVLYALNKNHQENDAFEKINIRPLNSSQEIMKVLNQFEKEKFIIENKCADVFCQINKMQQLFLKNHEKIESSFKELLYDCFDEKHENSLDSNLKINVNLNNLYHYKTQSNKKNPNLINCMNMQNGFLSNSNISAPCNSIKANEEPKLNLVSGIKSPQINNINQFSSSEKKDMKINEIQHSPARININMEKERVFEESPKLRNEERKEDKSEKVLNSNSKSDSSAKKNNHEVQNKREEDSLVYQSHKEKINSLIEKDKNKKMNQSFYQPRKPNMKRKPKVNKSFQKFNRKFGYQKKIEYKKYNQFIQKTCQKCGISYTELENSGKGGNFCQDCRQSFNEDNEKSIRHINKRDSSYNRDNNDFHKYNFRSKNFIAPKKKFGPSNSSRFWNKGKNNFIKTKKDLSFNSHRYGPKTLHHSNSNFISRQTNRMSSPKPFGRPKKFGLNNPISKFKSKGEKDNYGIKKYNEKNLNDDFEVELNSVEESKNNESEEESEEKKEKSFNKSSNEFFRNRSEDDKSHENANNFDYFDNENDNDDNKNDMEDENEDVKEEENNIEDGNNEDDDFDVDF